MPYKQPPATALDFTFVLENYSQPPAGFVDVDFATDGSGGKLYSRVPGVIMNVAASWNRGDSRDSAISALFKEAEKHDIRRAANANNASASVEPEIGIRHGNANQIDAGGSVKWDGSIQPRERYGVIRSYNAKIRDLENQASPWANASVILDPKVGSPFLVVTPFKDRTIGGRYFSSAVFAPLWRKELNKPEPFGPVTRGRADLSFYRIRDIRENDIYRIGAPWPVNPIQPKDSSRTFPAGNGRPITLEAFDTPWGAGRPVDITRAVVYPDYNGPIDLPDDGNNGDDDTILIPTLRFYVVANSAQIVRVSDGADVPATSVQISTNADSYSWSFSASLAGNAAKYLVEGSAGEPVEVDVIVNGVTWRFLVDQVQYSEAWQRGSATIRGRSRSAYLAAPYTLPRDYSEAADLLAVQLAEQELPPGWSTNWEAANWIVPGDVWNYSGLAPIDAISRVAAAAGAYVQSDKVSDLLHVRSLYPVAPWDWISEAPDFQLPRDILTTRRVQKKPGLGINGVFVHGSDPGGILAKVVRYGTAGENLARTIVDPLITNTDPARYRGLEAIASSGRQTIETHELPLSASLGGLIEPGKLVAFGEDDGGFVTYWRGIVRGVTVSARASRSGNGGSDLTVRQSVEIERHWEI